MRRQNPGGSEHLGEGKRDTTSGEGMRTQAMAARTLAATRLAEESHRLAPLCAVAVPHARED